MALLAQPMLSLLWRKPALRRGAFYCVVLALIGSLAEIAVALSMLPVLASLGVDAGNNLGEFLNHVPPWQWLILFALAAALRAAIGWRMSVQEDRSTYELILQLQTRLYRALANAHWDAVRNVSPPRITNALQTQTYEAGYGFSNLVSVITATLLVIGYLISAALVFPIALPALLLILVVMWWLNSDYTDRVQAHSEELVDAQEELHQRFEDWVALSRISSLGVDSSNLTKRFEANAREAASHAVHYGVTSASTRISYDLALVVGLIIGVPAAWWLETPPALLVFGLLAFIRTLPKARTVQSGYQRVVNSTAPLLAVESLAEQLEADAVADIAGQAPLRWNALKLADVGVKDTARPDSDRWIIRNVDLELQFGQWLGVTGPTGAGKSTLSEVMLMLIRADCGEISVDGRTVNDELANDWRNQAAYVPQDVVLLDTSIRNNLRLYVSDANDEDLAEALRLAAADFVLDRLPEGLDTRAGPGGRWLSGGERQRIGIARALLRQPGLLVLDEPTAALDRETQARLLRSISALKPRLSVVIVTHRPEVLQLTERVILVEDGLISE